MKKIKLKLPLIVYACIILLILISFLETFAYPGYVLFHFKINPNMLYIVLLLVVLLIGVESKGKYKLDSRVSQFYKYFTVLISFSLVLFYGIDKATYPNYVFSRFHLHIEGLFTLFILTMLLYVMINTDFVKKISTKGLRSVFNIRSIIIVFVVYIFITNVLYLTSLLSRDIIYMVKHPLADYNEKVGYKIGEEYFMYTQFVRNNTEENSTILIPPQAFPWPQSGNVAYTRYFLHPRKLIGGKEYEPGEIDLYNDVNYVLIVWGETPTTEGEFTHGWPKFDIDAVEFICTEDFDKKIVTEGSYEYKRNIDDCKWGLIRL